jgi:endonuclease YncB( thermonuclease family)
LRQTVFAVVVTLATTAFSAAYADMLVGQAAVVDGDTIEIHGERIRMAGIDAPESRQVCDDIDGLEYRCGKTAAFALADRIGRVTVTCKGKAHDRYDRLIATCSAGGADLNAWVVEQGFAVAYRRYSKAYVGQEDAAKAGRRGVWAGAFKMPWDWRRAH